MTTGCAVFYSGCVAVLGDPVQQLSALGKRIISLRAGEVVCGSARRRTRAREAARKGIGEGAWGVGILLSA